MVFTCTHGVPALLRAPLDLVQVDGPELGLRAVLGLVIRDARRDALRPAGDGERPRSP